MSLSAVAGPELESAIDHSSGWPRAKRTIHDALAIRLTITLYCFLIAHSSALVCLN